MENVGGIYYEIKADTHALLQADKQVEDITNNMERGFDKADDAADGLNTGLSKLASTIKLVIAASTLREMARMVQSYQEMAERVQMATSSQDEFERVQKRLLNTANGTYRSLAEAQELYIRSADGLRSMGYSTEQAIDVQDSMSYAFVKNAASAERADSAISAFTKAINTGKVSADQWESITTAIPTVINDIATASGKTAAEVRALGAQGKLTASQLSEGLRNALDENAKAAAGMSNNLVDASVRMKTAITSMLVAVEVQTGVIQGFTNSIITAADTILSFSENSEAMTGYIDSATLAAKAFALVMAGRYAGSLKDALSGKLQSIAATRQQTAAENQSAQSLLIAANAAQRKTLADKEAAFSAVALAQAELNVARGSNAEMTALENLSAAKSRARAASLALVEAETAQAAASARAAAAARAASISFGLASKALALIGGPAGVAMIAAGALFAWYQSAQQAKQEAIEFADSLDGVIAKMREMNQAQLAGALADVEKSISAQRERIDDLNGSVKEAQAEYEKYIGLARQMRVEQDRNNGYVINAAKWFQTLSQRKRDVNDATDKLSRTLEQQSLIQEQLNQKARDSEEAFTILANNLRHKVPGASDAAIAAMASTIQVLDALNKKAANTGKNQPAEPEASPEAKKLIQNAERRLALSKLEGEARAKLQAQYDAEDAGIASGDSLVGTLQGMYAETERVTEARKKANSEGKKSESSAESIAQKLANLKQQSELAAGSTEELSREQAILLEQQSLGKGATQEQIALAGKYRGEIWDTANALKAQAAAEKLIPETKENASYQQDVKDLKVALDAKKITQEQYDAASERMAQQHQTNLAKISAEQISTNPIAEARGQVDPVQQVVNQNNQKLALMQQYQQQEQAILSQSYKAGQMTYDQYITAKQETDAQYLALRNAQETQYEQARIAAQWEIFRNQSQANEMLASSLDGLQSGASSAITGLLSGTQSLEESFANIGTTILNGVVSSLVQMGIEWVKSQMMGQAAAAASLASTMAQATAAASAWAPAAISASIATMGSANAVGQTAYAGSLLAAKGMAVAGARRYGGNVSAGNAYRINENGQSEIFQTAGGQQMFIPNQSGKVIPADKAGAGGAAVTQEVHFHIQTTGGIDDATMARMAQMMKQVSLTQIKDQSSRPGGMIQPRTKR